MKNLIKSIVLAIVILTALYKVTLYSKPQDSLKYSQITERTSTYKAYRLYQNEPFEFSSVTNIRFELFKEGNVKLNIYGPDGELIETLVDGEMQPGNYSIYFKAHEGLAPGEYFYEINFDGSKKVLKMFYNKI